MLRWLGMVSSSFSHPSGPEMGWRSGVHGYQCSWSASISCALHWGYLQAALLQRCLKNLVLGFLTLLSLSSGLQHSSPFRSAHSPVTFAQLSLGRELSKGLSRSQQDLGEACLCPAALAGTSPSAALSAQLLQLPSCIHPRMPQCSCNIIIGVYYTINFKIL